MPEVKKDMGCPKGDGWHEARSDQVHTLFRVDDDKYIIQIHKLYN